MEDSLPAVKVQLCPSALRNGNDVTRLSPISCAPVPIGKCLKLFLTAPMTASPQNTAGLISSTWEEVEGWQCSSWKLQPCATQSWYLGDLLGMALTPRPSSRSW